MTASVKILSTTSLDSSPAILLTAPNGKKILVNCGEGCQRIFLEFGQRLSTVHQVYLTHLSHDTLGGLPGMILTSADATAITTAAAAVSSSMPKQQKKEGGEVGNPSEGGNSAKRPLSTTSKPTMSTQLPSKDDDKGSLLPSSSSTTNRGIDLVGPRGLKDFIHALRHFMRREAFELRIHQGGYSKIQQQEEQPPSLKKQRRKATTGTRGNEMDDFLVETIECQLQPQASTLLPSSSSSPPSIQQPPPVNDETRTLHQRTVLSFIFTTPPILGKFLIDKAKALGIPPGPLYGKLKSGQTLTFTNPKTNQEQRVESSEVVEPGSPGVGVAILYYPTLDVLQQLQGCPKLLRAGLRCNVANSATTNKRENDNNECSQERRIELVIHLTHQATFSSTECQQWRQRFPTDTRQIFLDLDYPISMDQDFGSPFHSASAGALARGLLSNDIYLSPGNATQSPPASSSSQSEPPPQNHETDSQLSTEPIIQEGHDSVDRHPHQLGPSVVAVPLMEYTLLPRSKKGFVNHSFSFYKDRKRNLWNKAVQMVEENNVIHVARGLLSPFGSTNDIPNNLENSARESNSYENNSDVDNNGLIIFAGTGAAIPCKHRNVSGIYLETGHQKNAILLDVGEGTVGQLLRAKQKKHNYDPAARKDVLSKIRAVWISHPHADHHLGILRLLAERNALLASEQEQREGVDQDSFEPVIVIAPPNLKSFLNEYEHIDPWIPGSYVFVDCRNFLSSRRGSSFQDSNGRRRNNLNNDLNSKHLNNVQILERLERELGITRLTSIPVAHCPYSYAVEIQGTAFGRVAYSGDCRPSMAFSDMAKHADLLIHEATFTDDMKAEAALKRHCTVGEALTVGRRMQAKHMVLTHFSQRYPKIPPLSSLIAEEIATTTHQDASPSVEDRPVIFAFDFMRLTPSNLVAACKITPALRLLYPENAATKEDDDDVEDDEQGDGECTGAYIMAIPGLFAHPEIL